MWMKKKRKEKNQAVNNEICICIWMLLFNIIPVSQMHNCSIINESLWNRKLKRERAKIKKK